MVIALKTIAVLGFGIAIAYASMCFVFSDMSKQPEELLVPIMIALISIAASLLSKLNN